MNRPVIELLKKITIVTACVAFVIAMVAVWVPTNVFYWPPVLGTVCIFMVFSIGLRFLIEDYEN